MELNHSKIELETLENGIGNIRKWNLGTLENNIENIGKLNWDHWKMKFGTLENSIENIGKLHWKIETEIGNIGYRQSNDRIIFFKIDIGC